MNSEGTRGGNDARGPYFTPEQYDQILKLFGKENIADNSANSINIAGNDAITAFLVE